MFKPTWIKMLLTLSAASVVLYGCSSDVKELTPPKYDTKLAADETSNTAFEKQFPQQYATYQRNNEEYITEFGGSYPYLKNDNVDPLPKGYKNAQPYLKNLWLGYPFSYEYNKARGHTNAIKDILHIDRINNYSEQAGLPATCWNCKTTKIPAWNKEFGDKFWAMNFNEFRGKDRTDVNHDSIGCAYCHNPQTMELVITSVPLQEALQRQGIDWKKASRNEMRSYVCGQCHVEYYFQEASRGVNKKPMFPWDNGRTAEAMFQYYKGVGPIAPDKTEKPFADWVHPVSKTPMLKAQHPEFEFWGDGPHGSAGVSCADCHMAYVRMDGKKKVSSHHWASPLKDDKTIDGTCRQCHADKTVEYLRDRVLTTQKAVFAQLLKAQEMSVRAHEAVRLASEYTGEKRADYDKLMADAREMVRKGQWFWDLVSAENSVGFHNPVKAMDTLTKSQQFSDQAVAFASMATNYGIAKDLEGDITKIVPPILHFSREQQMDPQFMKSSGKWLTYLPVLPKAERVWNGQERLIPPATPVAATAPAAAPATK